MPKSIAIWYSDTQDEEATQNLSLELHINLWRIEKSDFADFGLKIIVPPKERIISQEKPAKIFTYTKRKKSRVLRYSSPHVDQISTSSERSINLKIYFPFRRDNAPDVSNLIDILRDEDIYLGIFNKPLAITAQDGDNYILTEDENNKIYMYNQKATSRKFNGGILVEFDNIPLRKENSNSTYLRFRIPLEKSDNLFSIDEDNNFFDPIENHMNALSITINEFRNIEESVKEYMYNDKLFNLKRVDFLAVRHRDEEIKILHKILHRCREVEKDKWQKYIEVGNLVKSTKYQDLLAYHWKDSSNDTQGIGHFYAYAVFFSKKPTLPKIFIYLILILILGASSGVLGNLMTEYLKLYYNNIFSEPSINWQIIYCVLIIIASSIIILSVRILTRIAISIIRLGKRICSF